MLGKRPRSRFFQTFRLSILFPIILVAAIAFYWSFKNKSQQLNQIKGSHKARYFIKPGVFYPSDKIMLYKELGISKKEMARELKLLQKQTDKSLSGISQKPVIAILPSGSFKKVASKQYSHLIKLRQFAYKKILIIAPVTSGSFAQLSLFSGQGFKFNDQELALNNDIYLQQATKTHIYSYRPTFFHETKIFNTILPLLHKIDFAAALGFVLMGQLTNKQAIQNHFKNFIKKQGLLIFLLNDQNKDNPANMQQYLQKDLLPSYQKASKTSTTIYGLYY
jgi:hypothetical protein